MSDNTDVYVVPDTYRAKSWSLSALQNYEACPYRYAVSRALGIAEEPGYALQNGIELHSLFEHYLLGDVQGVPPRLVKLGKMMQNLLKHKATAEAEYCLTRRWERVISNDPWRDPTTWLRGKIDAFVELSPGSALIVDLKSGKSYPYYQQQAELYTTIVMECHPHINEVTCEFWYSKTGAVESFEFDRFDQVERKLAWDTRANTLMLETLWAPRLGDGCKWCHIKANCPAYR